MMELQYRIQTTAIGYLSCWRAVPSDGDIWDYRDEESAIIYFEVRVKPEFVPGYYQDNGDQEVRWFAEVPKHKTAVGEWVRVNVTPAE
jgi:hypothetical protein